MIRLFSDAFFNVEEAASPLSAGGNTSSQTRGTSDEIKERRAGPLWRSFKKNLAVN